MTERIVDYYNRIHLDTAVVDRMIATAKAAKSHNTVRKPVLIAAACAAALVIGMISAFVLHMAEIPDFSYRNISRFEVSSTTEALVKHDGLTLWISGAYYNGEKMMIALTGTLDGGGQAVFEAPDSLKIAKDSVSFTVNQKSAELVNNEVILKKNGDQFTGVITLNAPCEDSGVLLKGSISAVSAYSGDKLIGKINGSFGLEDTVNHVYTQNEAELLDGNNTLHIRSIAAFPKGAINEPQIGLMMGYFVPDDYSDKGITATVLNEDGSEIAVIQHYQTRVELGVMHSLGLDFPAGRNVKVVFTDDDNQVIQEYRVRLNDPDDSFVVLESNK